MKDGKINLDAYLKLKKYTLPDGSVSVRLKREGDLVVAVCVKPGMSGTVSSPEIWRALMEALAVKANSTTEFMVDDVDYAITAIIDYIKSQTKK